MFIQSIECSVIKFDQLDFGPDLWVRGLTNLNLLKFNQALKQSFVTMEKVFEVSIWSIMARIARFHFWIENFSFSFSPKLLNHFVNSLSHCVLLFVLFPMVYNMWVFIAREYHHHFRFWSNGASSGGL
jgi:hypothetical protein